jgi:hypothetical protein
MGNMQHVRREPNGKVDNIQMLLSAVILYDASESQINK